MTTTVSQEAREAAENFMNAHGWLCEEDWSLVLEADREVIVKFFAKFEQSIRQSAERGEVVGYIIPEMLNRKSEFEANGIVLHSRPSGMATMPLYTLPTPPEAGA